LSYVAKVTLVELDTLSLSHFYSGVKQMPGELAVTGDFTMRIALPDTVASKYAITIPATPALLNNKVSKTVPIELIPTTETNAYKIKVSINDLEDG